MNYSIGYYVKGKLKIQQKGLSLSESKTLAKRFSSERPGKAFLVVESDSGAVVADYLVGIAGCHTHYVPGQESKRK